LNYQPDNSSGKPTGPPKKRSFKENVSLLFRREYSYWTSHVQLIKIARGLTSGQIYYNKTLTIWQFVSINKISRIGKTFVNLNKINKSL